MAIAGLAWYSIGFAVWILAVLFIWSILYGYGQAQRAYETVDRDV